VIHVIDTVIVGDVELPSPPMSIVDTARAAGNFTTLIAALEATGLDTVLADLNGSFTVFAPTDAAFSALGEDTINALLADTDALSDILLYHVIAGNEILADAAIAVAAGENSLVEMAKVKKRVYRSMVKIFSLIYLKSLPLMYSPTMGLSTRSIKCCYRRKPRERQLTILLKLQLLRATSPRS
jgi:hypothetical protein